MTPEEVVAWARGTDVRLLELKQIGGFSGGYLVDPNARDVAKDYRTETLSMLADLEHVLRKDPLGGNKGDINQLERLRARIAAGRPTIDSVRVAGDGKSVAALRENPSVRSILRKSTILRAQGKLRAGECAR
jgi:hypothetical protein